MLRWEFPVVLFVIKVRYLFIITFLLRFNSIQMGKSGRNTLFRTFPADQRTISHRLQQLMQVKWFPSGQRSNFAHMNVAQESFRYTRSGSGGSMSFLIKVYVQLMSEPCIGPGY